MIPENDLEVLHTLNLTVEQANEIMINNPFVIDWYGFIGIWVWFALVAILVYVFYICYCITSQRLDRERRYVYLIGILFVIFGIISIYQMNTAREIALENMDVIARILKLTTKTW